MKVLHLITRIENSGPNKVMIALAKAQVGLGAGVTVASLQPERDDSDIVAGLRAQGVAVRSIHARGQIGAVRAVGRLAAGMDVTHVHCLRSLCLAVLARCRTVVVTSHIIPDEDWPHTKGPVLGAMLAQLHYRLMARADRVVAINQRMHDRIAARGGRVVVLPNPADLPPLPNLSRPNPSRLGPARRLLCVGHLNSRKNQGLLLEALARMGPAAAGMRLDLLGDGPLRAALEQRARDLPCEVRFIGHVPNPELWFRDADLYLSAALSEGQPIAVLEALGHGLPCLLSDIPGHALPGAPAGSVRLFPQDPDALARAITDCAAAPACAPDTIADWARSSFAPAAVAARYLALYRDLLAARRAG